MDSKLFLSSVILLLFVVSVISIVYLGFIKGEWKSILLVIVGFGIAADLLIMIGNQL